MYLAIFSKKELKYSEINIYLMKLRLIKETWITTSNNQLKLRGIKSKTLWYSIQWFDANYWNWNFYVFLLKIEDKLPSRSELKSNITCSNIREKCRIIHLKEIKKPIYKAKTAMLLVFFIKSPNFTVYRKENISLKT